MPRDTRSKRRVGSDTDFDDFSDQSDVSFTPKTTKKRTKLNKDTSSKRRRIVSKSNEDSKDGITLQDEAHIATSVKPHATSDHVIADTIPLQKALLAWYAGVHEARGMPWRQPYNPAFTCDQRAQRAYEVWISEIMLQQTQVVTVIPYYNRWMARFPTIKDLAASDIETVNALWKGLGYYSRAARLLSAAKKVVDELDGRLPDNAKDMEAKIPGIGRYSAGAICSIAYNECVPVLDGNVNRLMSRLLALHANPKAKPTLDILWAGAEAMVSGSDQAGDINQALIELGATVCKVRDPDCSSCPLQQWCRAYRYEHTAIDSVPSASSSMNAPTRDELPDIEELCGLCEPLPVRPSVTAFPMKVDRKKAREELDIVNVVEWRRNAGSEDRWFLLVKRPEGGLLAGLHEFPTLPDVSNTLSTTAMQEVPQRLLSNLLTVPLPSQPFCRTAKKARSGRNVSGGLDVASTNAGDLLRITSIRPAGDVIHVFSHIRKTYRIQWVLLEGGGSDPPSLTSVPSDLGIGGEKPFTKAQKKAKKVPSSSSSPTRPGSSQSGRKASSLRRDDSPLPSLSDDADPRVSAIAPGATVDESLLGAKGLQQTAARWLLMKDVSEANIGTGVLKVWKQVSTLWASDALTGPEVE